MVRIASKWQNTPSSVMMLPMATKPPVIDIDMARPMWEQGIPEGRIALVCGVSRRTVGMAADRYGWDRSKREAAIAGDSPHTWKRPPAINPKSKMIDRLADAPELKAPKSASISEATAKVVERATEQVMGIRQTDSPELREVAIDAQAGKLLRMMERWQTEVVALRERVYAALRRHRDSDKAEADVRAAMKREVADDAKILRMIVPTVSELWDMELKANGINPAAIGGPTHVEKPAIDYARLSDAALEEIARAATDTGA